MISVFFSFILLFILSFVFSSLSLSFSSVFFLCLCLRVMWYVSLCVVVCFVVWCVVCVCVVRCGACRVVWHAENPVSRLKTPPCVHSKRPRVCRQHAHMLFNMCAWCRYTRRRFECTHGGVLDGHTGSSPVLLAKKSPRGVITCSRGSPKKPLDHTHFQFDNRSTKTCSRFLQSFALPDEAVQLKLS